MFLTLRDHRPPRRYDEVPWTQARLESSDAFDGAWSEMQTFTFDEPDDDPECPAARSFTSTDSESSGEDNPPWVRLVFVDDDGNEQAGVPLSTGPFPHLPVVDGVSAQLRARTKNDLSDEVGVFDETTRPTAAQVDTLILGASRDVVKRVGGSVPGVFIAEARRVTEIRTAMLIERSYLPEQSEGNSTIYQTLRMEYDDTVGQLSRNVWAWQGAL